MLLIENYSKIHNRKLFHSSNLDVKRPTYLNSISSFFYQSILHQMVFSPSKSRKPILFQYCLFIVTKSIFQPTKYNNIPVGTWVLGQYLHYDTQPLIILYNQLSPVHHLIFVHVETIILDELRIMVSYITWFMVNTCQSPPR